MMRYLYTCCLLIITIGVTSGVCIADVGDHLKKIESKSKIHSMRNIDYIYMINLDQRPEKLRRSMEQLASYGIYPHRFSAVNGWELSLETLNDVGLRFAPYMEPHIMGTCYLLDGHFEPSHQPIIECGRTYFSHCMARGTIGIALSHISILQDAFDSGFETIWVMEDDIEVLQNPHYISDRIAQLDALIGPTNWDILFTDRDIRDHQGNYRPTYWAGRRPDYLFFSQENQYSMRLQVSSQFIQIGARSGAHSMILRRSGIKKLLQFFNAHQIFFPYDMEYILPRGIRLFTLAEDIVSNLPNAPSDNGGPYYLESVNNL